MKQCKNRFYTSNNEEGYSCDKCGRVATDAKELCKSSVIRLEKEKKVDKKLQKRKLKLEKKLQKIQQKIKFIECQINSL